VRRVCRAVEENIEAIPTLAKLGAALGASPHHLQRQFKAMVEGSPHQYGEASRLGCPKLALREDEPVA